MKFRHSQAPLTLRLAGTKPIGLSCLMYFTLGPNPDIILPINSSSGYLCDRASMFCMNCILVAGHDRCHVSRAAIYTRVKVRLRFPHE